MIKRIALALLALVVIVYVAALGVLYFKQRDFQYEPGTKVWTLQETTATGIEPISITVPGGAVVNGWYKPPVGEKPTILFYKGNTDSFGSDHVRFERWTADGYGFLAFDYRGFPASPGSISQENMLADALAVFDWLQAREDHIVIWGRSIGTGPATYTASQREADALLLETPYLSTVKVGQERYWYMPIAWLMHDQFPSEDWIRTVDEPVMVAHGTGDRTIPVHHGEGLFKLAPNGKQIWIEPGAGHSDLWAAGLPDRAEAFFEAVEAAR